MQDESSSIFFKNHRKKCPANPVNPVWIFPKKVDTVKH